MGKRKILKKNSSGVDSALKARSLSKGLRKKVTEGKLYVESTYNNTKLSLTDKGGNVLAWSSSGALGFKGAKKGTPFAATKIGELLLSVPTPRIRITGAAPGAPLGLATWTPAILP